MFKKTGKTEQISKPIRVNKEKKKDNKKNASVITINDGEVFIEVDTDVHKDG